MEGNNLSNSTEKGRCVLTLGETIYKTSGNIIFSDCETGKFVLAESKTLERLDKAIQRGILDNGMQMLLNKVRN